MNRSKQWFAAAMVIVLCGSAHADWKGKGEAGLVFARGNSDTDSLNLKLEMSQEVDLWKHQLDMSVLRATTSGSTSADRYQAAWQSDYNLSDRSFLFGGLHYDRDKFSGFDYQANATTGFGYKVVDTEQVKLAAQVGAGYRRLKNSLTQKSSGDAIATAGFGYENQLNASTKVLDTFRVESGSANTLVANFLGLEVKMNHKLALALGLDLRRNSNPPGALKKTDALTTTNLVYSF